MTDELDALVKPLAWAEESPNFWIGRGSFGYQRDFMVFDGAAKVRIGTIGARVTPDHARGFYDREYVAFVLEAIDRTALDAVKRAAKVEALREAAAWHEREAAGAMNSLHCGSENSEYRAANRLHDFHKASAAAILALIEREGV